MDGVLCGSAFVGSEPQFANARPPAIVLMEQKSTLTPGLHPTHYATGQITVVSLERGRDEGEKVRQLHATRNCTWYIASTPTPFSSKG